ncbi:unnamed protein product [Parascedosporium putredinis]|uniref:Uncharacterized protein n=1 Tax=Parascedosporium putredinis TaxID=1442378 RepID=A0A9P1HC15_9PEZI|nr:unnamed protein product [Parascedosporium putredinis]CAI8002567.1 unnamed protein product [Parascedosporium putredinis]
MTRPRGSSGASEESAAGLAEQNEWRVLSSQTIGVEFSSKIIKVGTGARRKRIKLQLSLLLAGNKLDLASEALVDTSVPPLTPSSVSSTATSNGLRPFQYHTGGQPGSLATSYGTAHSHRTSMPPEVSREVSTSEATRWASSIGIPVTMETSAFTGDNVDEIFGRLARMILTKIELGEIDPDDPMSGIQYGDNYGGGWNAGASDGASIKSSMTGGTIDDIGAGARRRRPRGRTAGRNRGGNWAGLREWEEVFTIGNRRRGGNCC